jgi:hypothetical protein
MGDKAAKWLSEIPGEAFTAFVNYIGGWVYGIFLFSIALVALWIWALIRDYDKKHILEGRESAGEWLDSLKSK